MVGRTKFVAVMACLFVLLIGLTAQAGILNGNALAYSDGNGPNLGSWSGSSPYVNNGLNGTIDWAVFTANVFNSSPVLNTSGYIAPAGELVYAHQIFSAGSLVGV